VRNSRIIKIERDPETENRKEVIGRGGLEADHRIGIRGITLTTSRGEAMGDKTTKVIRESLERSLRR
jgi:hypothetical protein